MPGKVERHERHPGADTSRHHCLDLDFGGLGTLDPDIVTILDASVIGVARMDFDEHVLLQFSQPRVGTGFIATTLVFDQSSRGQDDRVISGEIGHLDRLVTRRQPPE